MADQYKVEKLIADFMLKTCRRRRTDLTVGQCLRLYAPLLPTLIHGRDDTGEERHCIATVTGSSPEFYIQPPLSCVGDIDVMGHHNNELAIPAGHQPPTTLSADFHSRIKVYEIIDSPLLPGYVHLVLAYTIAEGQDGEFRQVMLHRVNYASCSDLDMELVRKDIDGFHGPACSVEVPLRGQPRGILADLVPCKRCLVWPTQAADWPTRQRRNGWPDSATVGHVIDNGCDVVPVAHRLCREDEWMNRHQWRLSFSRAEIVLINSWAFVQQIVYHVLRSFMKDTQMTDSVAANDTEACPLSNYHIKTLMLWACELNSKTWWTTDQNIIRICVFLLHTLALCISQRVLRHYFVSNCNLLNHFSRQSETTIANKLESVERSVMSFWFANRYVRQCAALHVVFVPHSFYDLNPTDVENVLSGIIYRREHSLGYQHSLNHWRQFSNVACSIPKYCLPLEPLDIRACRRCLIMSSEIGALDSGLSHFFAAYVFLRASFLADRQKLELAVDYVDEMATFIQMNKTEQLRFALSQGNSFLSLSHACKLMKVVANNSCSTVQLIEIELSKAYLYRALRCNDSDTDSFYCLANVYLAVLYYTTKQYQTAIDHCTLVTRSQITAQCSSHVVQGELLPKIDDNIDNVLGLAVLYQYVRTAELCQQRPKQVVNVFTTELFAHHLETRWLSVGNPGNFAQTSSSNMEVQWHKKKIAGTLFIADVLLTVLQHRPKSRTSASRMCQPTYRQPGKITSPGPNTPELAKLLQQFAVERLTTFRKLEATDFGCVTAIATGDFEALYAYRCGDYQRCFKLCLEVVRLTAGVSCSELAKIWIYPEFVQLFDDDFASLAGLAAVLNPDRSNDEEWLGLMISMLVTYNGRTSIGRRAVMCVNQRTLSLYLMTHCQVKLGHCVASVAETMRCVQLERRRSACRPTDDQPTLKLAERKAIMYMRQQCLFMCLITRYIA